MVNSSYSEKAVTPILFLMILLKASKLALFVLFKSKYLKCSNKVFSADYYLMIFISILSLTSFSNLSYNLLSLITLLNQKK